MKKIWGYVAYLLILCLVSGEIFFRIMGTPEERLNRHTLVYNKLVGNLEPDLGYKILPGIDAELGDHPDYAFRVKTDPLIFENIGFRDDGLDKEIYAIAIGDSFTWGYGVNNDEIWTEVMEDMLDKDIVNLGMPAFSIMQYAIMLKKYGLRFKPKVILIGFFTGNDYSDHSNFQEWKNAKTDINFYSYFSEKEKLKNKLKHERKQKKFRHRLSKALQNKSALYRFLRKTKIKAIIKARKNTIATKEGTIRFEPDLLLRNADESQKDNFIKDLATVERTLGKIKDVCLENSIDLYVVIIPTKEEVYCDYISNMLAFNEEEKDKMLDHYSAIKEICRYNDIKFIDLLPELRKNANLGKKLYFTHDGHWNKDGNSLVASIIYNFFIRNLLPLSRS